MNHNRSIYAFADWQAISQDSTGQQLESDYPLSGRIATADAIRVVLV